MGDIKRLQVIGRRQFIVGALAAAQALPTALSAAADGPALTDRAAFDKLLADLTKGAKPVEGKIAVELPEIAENGNVVPISIVVDSPMTAESHVRAVHVLSTENPQPLIATFRFAPESGRAAVSSRMRLAKTQEVLILAELSDGKLLAKRATVKVTIGGCGG